MYPSLFIAITVDRIPCPPQWIGEMVDIVQALRNFIDHSDVAYRDEVIYCAAKQIYWNMTKSRELFQADFINLLKEYQKDFLLNPIFQQDKSVKKILDF